VRVIYIRKCKECPFLKSKYGAKGMLHWCGKEKLALKNIKKIPYWCPLQFQRIERGLKRLCQKSFKKSFGIYCPTDCKYCVGDLYPYCSKLKKLLKVDTNGACFKMCEEE